MRVRKAGENMEQGKERWERDEARALLARAADGAMAVNRHQRIVLWNAEMERLIGVTAGRALGKRCYEVLRGHDPSGKPVCHEGCPSIMAAGKGKAVRTRDLVVRGRGGNPLRLCVTALPGCPKADDGIAVAYLYHDVTSERRAQALGRRVLTLVHGEGDLSGACAERPELTRREVEVLELLVSGASTSAMAGELHISPLTARNHIRGVMDKLGAHSRAQAIAQAFKRGLIDARA